MKCRGNPDHRFPLVSGIPVLLPSASLAAQAGSGGTPGSDDQIAQYYDRVAGIYHEDHHVAGRGAGWVMRRHTWPRFKHALLDGGPILEIGSGTGFLTGKLLGLGESLVSTDISLGMARINAKENSAENMIVCDAEKLPFSDGSYQYVVGNNTFYHFNDKRGVAQALARVLKPGGRLVFSEMNPYFPGWYTSDGRVDRVDVNAEMFGRLLNLKREYMNMWFDEAGLDLVSYRAYSNVPYFAGRALIFGGEIFEKTLGKIPFLQKYCGLRIWIEAVKRPV
jgi:SAM-dependent methyltransferase